MKLLKKCKDILSKLFNKYRLSITTNTIGPKIFFTVLKLYSIHCIGRFNREKPKRHGVISNVCN